MTDALELELAGRLGEIRSGYEIVPFMTGMLPVGELRWKPLPDEMLAILVNSGDYQPVLAGDPPTWFDITAPQGELTLVIYRALADEQFYALAPAG